MNLVLSTNQYNIENVFFGEKTKNTIIWNSLFIKVFYSTEVISLNGIYLLLEFKNKLISKDYNKYKISFDTKQNIDIIHRIEQIEKSILHKINIVNKTPKLSVYDQCCLGYLKLFHSGDITRDLHLVLKISGIWENSSEYGITYKFYLMKKSIRPLSNNLQLSA